MLTRRIRWQRSRLSKATRLVAIIRVLLTVSDLLFLNMVLEVNQETARAANVPVQDPAKSSSDAHSPLATVRQ